MNLRWPSLGGVYQAPARIHRRMVQQPFDRPLAAPGQAGIDLAGLLGDVDVHRCGVVDGVEPGQRFAQGIGRHGPQRMRRQAQAHAFCVAERLHALQQLQHGVGAADEATLALVRGLAAEAAGLVEHGQERHADAGGFGCAQQGQGQLGVVGIGQAVGLVVDVVEFADGGVAGLQHLDVEPGGDGFDLLRGQLGGEAVHQGAPAPEAVLG